MQHALEVYATGTELADWLTHLQGRLPPLYFAATRYFPFTLEPLPTTWTPQALTLLDASVRELWIDLTPLNASGSSHLQCATLNRHRLELGLPEWRPEGLRIGALATMTDDPARLKAWQAGLLYFRKQTTAGMWVFNPTVRTKSFYRTLRYSPGIAALCKGGLQLLPPAGWNRVSIHEPGAA